MLNQKPEPLSHATNGHALGLTIPIEVCRETALVALNRPQKTGGHPA